MLSDMSIDALVDLVTGDSPLTPYQTGPNLISWFNPYGFNDDYADGLPPDNTSRKKYARSRIDLINKNYDMKLFLESIVDSRRFMKEANLKVEDAVEYLNTVLAHDGYVLTKIKGIFKLYQSDAGGEAAVTAVFEEIQERILKEIKSAEILVWVAVAWFTDKILFDALVTKRKSGVDVKVIINDDDINNKSGLDYASSFWVKKIASNSHFNNIMHHKFCIVDLKKVLHGSYNWTNKAKYNAESISVTEERTFATEFAKEFVGLSAE